LTCCLIISGLLLFLQQQEESVTVMCSKRVPYKNTRTLIESLIPGLRLVVIKT
jgi:hypothetical protein